MGKADIARALAVTAELTGAELSEAAMDVMVLDLAAYPEPQVMGALTRCRRECRSRLTLADVISRLDDGRPGPEEAWAMVPRDEATTCVWTDEMCEAWSVALPIVEDGDLVAGRVAFLEAYRGAVQHARDDQLPPQWSVSLGHDQRGREGPIRDAVEKGRLSHEHAQRLLPDFADEIARISGPTDVKSVVAGMLEKHEAE
ncbi:MAG: hypothetical protein ACPGVG_15190 [Mycobacterium sp.]